MPFSPFQFDCYLREAEARISAEPTIGSEDAALDAEATAFVSGLLAEGITPGEREIVRYALQEANERLTNDIVRIATRTEDKVIDDDVSSSARHFRLVYAIEQKLGDAHADG